MSYDTLVAGTVITSAWGNMVRDQLVNPFASASARASAISVPTAGMFTTLTDSDSAWLYDGSAWVPPNIVFIKKAADKSINSNTSVADDNHLILPVAANRTYEIRGGIIYADGSGTGRLKAGWSGPSGATFKWVADGLVDTTTANSAENIWRILNDIGDTRNIGSGGTETDVLLISGLLVTSSTAGNLTFRWAQVLSDAQNTTVKQDSWLIGQIVA